VAIASVAAANLAAAVVVVLKVKDASKAVLSHVSTIASLSHSSHVKITLMPVKAALAATLVKALLVATSVVVKTLVNPRGPVVLTTAHPLVALVLLSRQAVRLLTRHHVQLASRLVALTPRSALLSHAHHVNFQLG
jgi:hypothetical protein